MTAEHEPNPIPEGTTRKHDCPEYSACLAVAARSTWPGFSCVECPRAGGRVSHDQETATKRAQKRGEAVWGRRVEVVCLVCGRHLLLRPSQVARWRTCSVECGAARMRGRRVDVTCGSCGESFGMRRSDYRAKLKRSKSGLLFCSVRCANGR